MCWEIKIIKLTVPYFVPQQLPCPYTGQTIQLHSMGFSENSE